MKTNALLFLFTLLINTSFISAQELNLAFESIGVEDGLDAGYNYFIKKDSRGYVWISSIGGLFRFDGTEVKKYMAEPEKPNSMLGNNIQSDFFEDAKGDIWFTTVEGINVYQPETDDFRTLQLVGENGDTLRQDYHIFYLEQEEWLWLRIGETIYKYNIDKRKSIKIIKTKGTFFGVSTDSIGSVKEIYSCPMISTSGFEVFFVNEQGVFEKKIFLSQGVNGKIVDVRDVIIKDNSKVWFCSKSGLITYDVKRKEVESFLLPSGVEGGFETGVLYDENQLLLGGQLGLWLFNISEKRFTKVDKVKYYDGSDLDMAVMSLTLDNQDQIWASNYNEKSVYFGWKRGLLFKEPSAFLNDKYDVVQSLIEVDHSTIWQLSSNKIFLYESDGRFIDSLSLRQNNGQPFEAKAIIEGDGEAVFACNGNEVFEYMPPKKYWNRICLINSEMISFIQAVDSTKIFISTNERFLMLYKDSLNAWNINDLNIEISPFNRYQFFVEADDLLFFPLNRSKLEIYKIVGNSIELLAQTNIDFELYTMTQISSTKEYLLGTNQGVKKLKTDHTNEWEIENFWDKSEVVFSILEDEAEGVWCSTSDGLYLLKEGSVSKYTTADGLPSNDFNLYYSGLKSENVVWLGTKSGGVCFNPKEISPYSYQSIPQLEMLAINNVPVDSSYGTLWDLNRLELEYNENSIVFKLKSIGTRLASSDQVFYRIAEFGRQWSKSIEGEEIYFNSLSPGSYRFEYFVRNVNNVDSDVRSIEINVDAPFWTKWWFYLSCLVGFIGLVYLLVKMYVRNQLKKQRKIIERQKALEVERNRIAGELHDDMGAGLLVIKYLSERLSLKEKDEKEQKHLMRINDSSKDLLIRMKDIIWAMNTENDSLRELIDYMSNYAEEYLQIHGIFLKKETDRNIPDLELSGKQRRNILLVLKESLNNVVKHASASEVSLKVIVWKNKINIAISDNGIGLDGLNKSSGGNGMKNIKKRIEDIQGEVLVKGDNGTTIDWTVPIDSL